MELSRTWVYLGPNGRLHYREVLDLETGFWVNPTFCRQLKPIPQAEISIPSSYQDYKYHDYQMRRI